MAQNLLLLYYPLPLSFREKDRLMEALFIVVAR
jgi:hypothetical protein